MRRGQQKKRHQRKKAKHSRSSRRTRAHSLCSLVLLPPPRPALPLPFFVLPFFRFVICCNGKQQNLLIHIYIYIYCLRPSLSRARTLSIPRIFCPADLLPFLPHLCVCVCLCVSIYSLVDSLSLSFVFLYPSSPSSFSTANVALSLSAGKRGHTTAAQTGRPSTYKGNGACGHSKPEHLLQRQH